MNHDEQVEMKLAEMLADRPPQISELALALRQAIADFSPNSSELLYQTYAVSSVFTYSHKLGQAFIHIATYAEHVNLGFNRGADLEDPDKLLKGTGKLIRHLRIDSVGMVKKESVKQLILAAIKLGHEMAENAGGVKEQSFMVKTK